MIHPNSHPTYNERQQKIIDMIDGVLEKYTAAVNTKKNQQNEEEIINNIIEELDKKREVAINKKQKTLLKDKVLEYGEEEDIIVYVIFIIREATGKLY
jgi:actin-related protein